MPTYQYRCTDCGGELEAVQKFSDPALSECPNCSGQLRKVFNAVGVVFKGSGFYRTDSRNSASKEAVPAGKGADTTGKSSESPSTSGNDKASKSSDGGSSKPKVSSSTEAKVAAS